MGFGCLNTEHHRVFGRLYEHVNVQVNGAKLPKLQNFPYKNRRPEKASIQNVCYKVGPLPVITGFITPITRVTRTVSHL